MAIYNKRSITVAEVMFSLSHTLRQQNRLTRGSLILSFDNLHYSACIRDSPNGNIGNFTNGAIVSQWYHWKPEHPERFSAANGTICANITIGGNVGTIGVNRYIMIKTSNLFLYSYFYVYEG